MNHGVPIEMEIVMLRASVLFATALSVLVGISVPSAGAETSNSTKGPLPPDTCWGVKVRGGGSALQDAVRDQGPGTTFCIAAGTYTVDSAGLLLEDGDTLDGAGVASPGRPGGAKPIVKIKGAGTSVITGGADVTIKDVNVADSVTNTTCSHMRTCGRLVHPAGHRWTIRRSWLHGADAQCVGSPGRHLLVKNTKISRCGIRFDGLPINGFAGGIKATRGYKIVNSYVHNNNQGIWCDRDCSSAFGAFVVKNNIVTDNCLFGIHYEQTYFDTSTPASAIISGNEAKGNAWCGQKNKSDIGIASAENATITNNQVGATPAHPAKGLGIHAFDRRRGPSTGSATGNFLNGDKIECVSPYVCSNNR
jgi:hypothetical protein